MATVKGSALEEAENGNLLGVPSYSLWATLPGPVTLDRD